MTYFTKKPVYHGQFILVFYYNLGKSEIISDPTLLTSFTLYEEIVACGEKNYSYSSKDYVSATKTPQ